MSPVNMSRPSVQLFTLREAAAEDLTGALRRLAQIGYTMVEPFDFPDLAGLAEALQASGLTAPTAHSHIVAMDRAELDRTFAAAAALGVGTVIEPIQPAEHWRREEDVLATAQTLGAAAAVAAGHGIRVGYHNHAHELQASFGEQSGLELLAAHLDPEVVLEVDTYWAAVGGADPVALLGRLGEQVAAIHVKDGPVTSEALDQTAVGQGSMPIPAILAAAPQALRVVELDNSRGDRFQAVADSLAYLTSLDD